MKKVVWFEVSSIAWGGGPRFMINAAEKLADLGYDVSFLHLNSSEEVEIRSNLKFVTMNRGSDIGMQKNYGIGFGRVKRVWARLAWIRAQIKAINPDVVITTGQWESSSWLKLSCVGLKFQMSTFVYGSLFSFSNDNDISKFATIFKKSYQKIIGDYSSFGHISQEAYSALPWKKKLLNDVEAYLRYWANSKADRIFTLTQRVADEVKLMYGKKAQPLPLSIPGWDDMLSRTISPELKMVYFGRLITSKRVIDSIKLFEFIADRVEDFSFHIIGSGADKENIESYIAASRHRQRIRMLGFVSDDVLKHEIETALFTINLDIADFDLTTLESLAAGRPAVVSKICDLDPNFFELGALISEEYIYQSDSQSFIDSLKNVDRTKISELVRKNYLVDDRVLQLVQ